MEDPGVSCRILSSNVICSGSMISVGEERTNLSAIGYL